MSKEEIKALPEDTLGERLFKARSASGLTQDEVSEKLKINPDSYGKYERNKIIPPITKIKLLTELFGISADYLLFGRADYEIAQIVDEIEQQLNLLRRIIK